MPEIASESRHFQCRHIFTDGRRCGSKCLHAEPLCYYHHTTRGHAARRTQQTASTDRLSTFELPLPEDRSAIQLAIGEIIRRIAAGNLDSKRAGLLLYALQIASLNLPREPHTQTETVEEITDDPDLGPLAPEHELRKTRTQILIEELRESNYARPRTATLPTIQAVAVPNPHSLKQHPALAVSCQLTSSQLSDRAFADSDPGTDPPTSNLQPLTSPAKD